MYFVLGMMRSTVLYFGLVSVIKASSFEALLLYLAAVLVHTVFCKLTKDDRSTGEIVFSILGHDTVAPFLARCKNACRISSAQVCFQPARTSRRSFSVPKYY